MRKRRITLSVVLAMTTVLLVACGRSISPMSQPTTTPCTPSILDSFPNALEPGSLLMELRMHAWHLPDCHTPELTLLADGSIYYLDGQTMVAHLKPEETLALVQGVLDLGFECLEDGKPCWPAQEEGMLVCMTDEPFWFLEVRLPNGRLRGIHDYYGVVDSPEALLSIREELVNYQHPEAQPYSEACPCAREGRCWP